MKTELHPHQLEALSKMHNGCVLHGGVGSGKTITALAYALRMEPDKQIVVVTTAKVRDSFAWEKEAAKLNVGVNDIQVTSWNKIDSLIGYVDHFFIFDEQRLVGSGAWVKAFYKIAKANRWILLSATPGDTWSDYAPMFIANGWYKNITEFRREHAIYSRFTKFPKIERWVGEGKLQKYRKQLLVKMPMERHTTRHMHHIECDYDKDTLELVRKRRWNIFKDEPIKNASELFNVMRKIVSTDPSRVYEIKKLMQQHPKLIIFYNFNYELDILRDLCKDLEELDKNGDLSWVLKESKTSIQPRLAESATRSRPSEQLAFQRTPHAKPSKPLEKQDSRPTESRLLQQRRSQPPASRTKETDSASSKLTTRTSTTAESWLKNQNFSTESLANGGISLSGLGDLSPITNGHCSLDSAKEMPSGRFTWAEWNGHKHEPLPTSDSWIYLVQYTSGSEGWNCVETDAMAFWSLTYSWKQFHQAQGRIDRLNTPFSDLHYYVLMTNSFAEKPVMMALNQKHDFQPR